MELLHVVVVEGLVGGVDRLIEGRPIRDLDALGSPHGDSLEVLGAHDGPHAGPPGRAAGVVHDAGVADHVLARGADARHLGPQRGGLLHRLDGLLGVKAPYLCGIPQLHLVIVDEEIDRLGGLALDDDHVVARVLEAAGKIAGGGRVGDGPGERRLGHHDIPVGGRGARAGQGAGHEEHLVLRAVRIDGGIDLVVQVLHPEAATADVVLGPLPIEVLDRDLGLGEIDTQHFPHPAVHSLGLLVSGEQGVGHPLLAFEHVFGPVGEREGPPGAELDALGDAAAEVALLGDQGVSHSDAAVRAGENTHLAAHALLIVDGDDRGPGQVVRALGDRAGRADACAPRILALAADHRDRHLLLKVDGLVDARLHRVELPVVPERAHQLADPAPGALVDVDIDHLRHWVILLLLTLLPDLRPQTVSLPHG